MSRRWMAQLAGVAALSVAAPVALWFASPGGRALAPVAWDAAELSELPAGHRELEWAALIPEGWDPLPQYRGVDGARLRDSDPLARQWQQDMRTAFENAPVQSALDGAAVRLRGYVVPLDPPSRAQRRFLLVPYFGACIHTPPPPSNQIVLVTSRAPVATLRAMRVVAVTGTLRVRQGDPGDQADQADHVGQGPATASYELEADAVRFKD